MNDNRLPLIPVAPAPGFEDASQAAAEMTASATASIALVSTTQNEAGPTLANGDPVAGEHEADGATILGLPAAPNEYRPPDPSPGDAPLDIATIAATQTLAFNVGATDSEYRDLWTCCMAFQNQYPSGMDANTLALAARGSLAKLDGLLGEDRVDMIVNAADAVLARIQTSSGRKAAQFVRDAAVRDPRILSTLGQIGRRLPTLIAHRKAR